MHGLSRVHAAGRLNAAESAYGHHGLEITGWDNLAEDINIRTRLLHDLTVVRACICPLIWELSMPDVRERVGAVGRGHTSACWIVRPKQAAYRRYRGAELDLPHCAYMTTLRGVWCSAIRSNASLTPPQSKFTISTVFSRCTGLDLALDHHKGQVSHGLPCTSCPCLVVCLVAACFKGKVGC
jgi:hypothetical protein